MVDTRQMKRRNKNNMILKVEVSNKEVIMIVHYYMTK